MLIALYILIMKQSPRINKSKINPQEKCANFVPKQFTLYFQNNSKVINKIRKYHFNKLKFSFFVNEECLDKKKKKKHQQRSHLVATILLSH